MPWQSSYIEKQPDGTFKAKTAKPQHTPAPAVYQLIIGIDTGKNTGFATYSPITRRLLSVETLPIHKAMQKVYTASKTMKVLVRFEDARKRKWFGNAGKEKLQGAGSIKRDAVIWEDYLKDLGIPFEAVAPKSNKTKLSAEAFKKLTGWSGRTSNHGRDAAMLVIGF